MIAVAIQCEPPWKDGTDWEVLARKAATLAIRETPYGDTLTAPVSLEISIKLSDNREVQALNAAYRDKDKPTNILSFPMVQPDILPALANSDDEEALLGDIILAYEICAAEAAEKQLSLGDHATHLIVHGMLHLLGYDHETGEIEAEAMEAMERSALAALRIADPYGPIENMDEV